MMRSPRFSANHCTKSRVPTMVFRSNGKANPLSPVLLSGLEGVEDVVPDDSFTDGEGEAKEVPRARRTVLSDVAFEVVVAGPEPTSKPS